MSLFLVVAVYMPSSPDFEPNAFHKEHDFALKRPLYIIFSLFQ